MYQPSQQVRYRGAIAIIVDALPSVISYDYLILCDGICMPVAHSELENVTI